MGNQFKSLEKKNNNDLWEWYYQYRLSLNAPKTSLNSYKTHLKKLEQEIQKDFENITIDEIQNVNQKSKSFIAGFYIDCISNRKMKPCTDVILSLIPQEYKNLVQVILD